jgi:hypothetical protein
MCCFVNWECPTQLSAGRRNDAAKLRVGEGTAFASKCGLTHDSFTKGVTGSWR